MRLKSGSTLRGMADLVLECGAGYVVIDHPVSGLVVRGGGASHPQVTKRFAGMGETSLMS